MKLRVCFVNSFYPPWRGGAERYVSNLAMQLVKRGHDVTVLCASDPAKPGEEVVEGVSVRRLRSPLRIYGTPLMPSLPSCLAEASWDIIHANFPSPYGAFISAVLSRATGIPCVLTFHNDLPGVTFGARLLVEVHDSLVLPIYIRRFKRIIATSSDYCVLSGVLRRFREKVTVIPNGVDCQLFAPSVDGAEIRHRYGLEGCFVVLFVAALTKWHRYKGLDVLLDAFQAVRRKEPKARLLVVGEGDLLPEYASKARRLGIQSSVTFVGGVPDPTLPCFYASADVLVLPSRDKSEGFGLTLLEANACGKPVIGSKVGGVPSVVKDGFNGFLVPPNDPPSLANAILTLLRDERLRLEMGKNGRGWAEQHDWSMVAEATVELYCEVLKQT